MFYRKDAKTLRKKNTWLTFFSPFIPLRLCAFAVIFLCGCSNRTKTKVDLIIHHAVVYTVDSTMSTQQAFAVMDGKIVAVSSNDSILNNFEAVNSVDAQGKAVYPGFIDSHCHFLHYGLGLNKVDLVGTKSFDEVIERVVAWSKANPKAQWIIGRGWDQNDWSVKEFPDRFKLDSLFPNTPIILKRIDGHAALANATALKLAGIQTWKSMNGGDILIKSKTGKLDMDMSHVPFGYLSGILIDNAVDLVEKIIPPPSEEEMKQALLLAQKNCFEVGLTTVDDAGLMKNEIDLIDKIQKENLLKMRIYAMLSDSTPNYQYYLEKGPYKTDRLNVRSFKFYADGALGSRGACLLKDYSDKKGWKGFLLRDYFHYERNASTMIDYGFQMNTHCIGDSAFKLMYSIYLFPHEYRDMMNMMKKDPITYKDKPIQNLRWRIEHAQVVPEFFFSPDMLAIAANAKGKLPFNIIYSVQPTHATSDMYWAKDRLGERVKHAYAYKNLLKLGGMLALGTDFPVEDISPFKTFFAAVARMDEKGFPAGGFQPENALTREETLKGMTIWGAFANFEEKEKGSIEKGKFADFIILDNDIMKGDIKNILSTKVISTYIDAKVK